MDEFDNYAELLDSFCLNIHFRLVLLFVYRPHNNKNRAASGQCVQTSAHTSYLFTCVHLVFV